MSEIVSALAPVAASLDRLNITWYLGGSVASSIYGLPRSTLDVDLVADLKVDQVAEFMRPLDQISGGKDSLLRRAHVGSERGDFER